MENGSVEAQPQASSSPRVLVVGCGGIGGIIAANLLKQNYAVTPLTRNQHIADAINMRGIRTHGELSVGTVNGVAVTAIPEKTAQFDYILLATQPPQVEEAARQVVQHLAPEGTMVCLQNGICEPRVAEIAGVDRVLGAVVAWGASMLEPGVYDRTSAGGFVLGRLDGTDDPRLSRLALMLETIGPVVQSDNLLGARWSKLAINCAISSLGTIGGERLGPLLRRRFVRRLALEIMSETAHTARAQGLKLEKVAGTIDLDWLALTDAERGAQLGSASLVAKHALLLAVGARYRRLRSSMLNAIERGRTPAVDFLNGEVVQNGERHGVPTPINEAIVAEVWRIARKEVSPGIDTLKALFERTRSATSAPSATAPPSPASEAPSAPLPLVQAEATPSPTATTSEAPREASETARQAADEPDP